MGPWVCTKRVKWMVEIYSLVQSIHPHSYLSFFPIRKVSTRLFTTKPYQAWPAGLWGALVHPRGNETGALSHASLNSSIGNGHGTAKFLSVPSRNWANSGSISERWLYLGFSCATAALLGFSWI